MSPYPEPMLECVPNVSEGRDGAVLDALARACGRPLLDRHVDADHHRSVFTLAGPDATDAVDAVRRLALAVADRLDIGAHAGVHPRLGALDVVPFVAWHGDPAITAVDAAREFAGWIVAELSVPVFLYDDADPEQRTLPDARREAFVQRAPDVGPAAPHPHLGAVAVGARPPLVAVNCELARDDVALARRLAHAVRERDGGLPGVRALGLRLDSVHRAQVSMNLVALDRTSLQEACERVRELARAAGTEVARVELVGLVPAAELARCDPRFLTWAAIGDDQTIECRLAR
ncbi:MAG: glutamate formiminotransferase / 5-formyltetrahydrofolate cyclo-ligase [Actinomycetota bacterium]|nr:glutamate formiminotransferase / 5-formyltetrahydrofolate cyclo-ligase [Actinomycetota bacterium]